MLLFRVLRSAWRASKSLEQQLERANDLIGPTSRATARGGRKASKSSKASSSTKPRASVEQDGAAILRALKAQHEEGEALIPIRELRQKTRLPAERFDAALGALWKSRGVSLHHHDYPAGLSESERAQLFKLGSTYYIGAAVPGATVAARRPKVTSESKVLDAVLTLGRGRGKRVKLADLRKQVDLSRDALDRLLKALQVEGKVVLYRQDNPAELTAADKDAALHIAGEPRHLVYLV